MKWSKLIIAGIALVGSFSVVYAMNTEMKATNASPYTAGGNVTGRVNKAPSGITGPNIGMQKGDKILMGTENPDTNSPLIWQLMHKRTYTDYASECTVVPNVVCNNPAITSWYSMTPESLGSVSSGLTTSSFYVNLASTVKVADYASTDIYTIIENLNSSIRSNPGDVALLTYRDLTPLHTEYINSAPSGSKSIADMVYAGAFHNSNQLTNNVFLYSLHEMDPVQSLVPLEASYYISPKDYAFMSDYWSSTFYHSTYASYYNYTNLRVNNNGSASLSGLNSGLDNIGSKAVRPSAYLKTDDIVFGISKSDGTASSKLSKINEFSLSSYSKLYLEGGEAMKVRLHEVTMKASLEGIVNTLGNDITEIEKGNTMYIKAKANIGVNYTVSVMLFDNTNSWKYYLPLTAAKGDDKNYLYEFDTTGIAPGSYNIAIVNEVYDNSSAEPSHSSLLSDTMQITVLDKEGMNSLTFTPTHTGGSDLTDVFKTTTSGNTQLDDILGHLSVTNGIGNPDHISYILLDDTGASGDYEKLQIPVDATTNYPKKDTAKAYVSVKETTGLLPDVYTFRVQAYDENGNPYPAVDTDGNEITNTSLLNTVKKVNESSFYNKDTPDGGNEITKDKVHGIISDDITLVVYPHDSQITYNQCKDENDEYYRKKDVNDTSFTAHLGELVFGTDDDTHANMQVLYDAGYRINTSTSKLMKKDSTTDAYTEFKITSDATKPYQFYIDKANNNITSGDHKFDAWLYFTNGDGDTALLKLKDQNLYIAPSLSYINPDKNTELLASDTYTRKYNAYASADNHENKFNLIATDKENLSTNASVKYCLLDETTKKCATSNTNDVVDITDNGNGTATLTAKTYHKDDPNIKVRAYIEDSSHTVLTYEDITIQINRAERKLKWEGKKISSLQSNVIDKETDYELKLPYDASNPISYSFERIANMVDALADGKLALRHDAGTGTISHTLNGNLAAGDSTDSFKINNQCTGTTCYIEVMKAQDDIFEAGKVRLYITTEDMAEIENAQVGWVYSTNGTTWQNTNDPLELTYKKDGTYPVKINKDLLPTDIADLDITYTLDDPDSLGTITVANKTDSKTEAKLDIVKANQTAANPRIKAVITSSNYATKTVYLPVKIKKLNQTLEFKDTTFKSLTSNIKLDTTATYDYTAILKVDETTIGGGTISYTVAGDPVDMVTNDANSHTFTVSKVGTVTITATVVDDQNHNTTTTNKTITKTITFYDDAGISWTQDDPKPEAINMVFSTPTGDAKTNKELGEIKIDGGKDSNYTFTIENSKHSDDSTFFTIVKDATNKAGTLKLLKDVDATILNAHATQVGTSDEYTWQIHVKAVGVNDATDVAEGDITITFVGAEPEIIFTKANTDKKIIDTYSTNGTLDLSVKRDDVSVSDPTINLTGYSGVIETTGSIKSANTDNDDNVRSGRKVELTAQVTASGGYKTGTSPKNEVIIKKADHPAIDFTAKTLSSSNNVDVGIEGILHSINKSNENVTITPIKVEESDPWIIDDFTMSKDQAYESPSIAVSPKGYIGVVEFNVTASGDDNYKPLPDDTKISLEFTEAGGIIYNPIEITYGDNTKEVLSYVTSPNPSDDPATVSYTFTGYDSSLIEVDVDGKITTKHVGETYITLKRIDSADNSEMEQRIKVKVKPKEIIIQPKDIHKKVGEVITNTEYELDTEKSGTFLTGDDIGTLVFSCQDNNVEVVDLPDGLKGPKELTISVAHTGGNPSDKQNYTILYKTATLYITQDTGLESWVSVIPQTDTELHNGWYNGPVDVKITAMAGSYEEISPDGSAPWAEKFEVSEEGKTLQDVYFRDPTTLAKASKVVKEIKIDSIAPKVTKITAKSSNNKLEDILHAITGGIFFKPGTEFTLTTSDQLVSGVKDTSGTAQVTYSIYKINGDESETEVEKDQVLPIQDETGKIKISDHSGTYKVCTKAKDHAQNEEETETCAKVTIGYEDVNITTGDGNCPDVNLDFNDDGKPELNIDLDGDGIPDLNIDSDFDGEPDINVDSDGDGRPDLNLVMLESWKPGICNTVNGKEYATQEGIKPEINVVIDNGKDPIKEQKPYLNIDTDGDMKADFNISFDGKEPYLNIGKVPNQWIPETDYTYEDFNYDTMHALEPLLNMGIIDEKYPSINVDTNGDGKPDLNIDINGDGIPDINIDGNGDGKADINIDTDGDGTADEKIMKIKEWKPEKLVDGKVPYKTMDITYEEEKGKSELEDNGIIIIKPDGSFLPKHAIKVEDITKEAKDTIQSEAEDKISDQQEVKVVYDVKLLEEGVEIQPDGSITVRIPIPEGIENPKLFVKKANGVYEEVKTKVENGYLVYETEELGVVSIIGDKAENTIPKEDPDTKDPHTEDPDNTSKPSTSVQGTYTPNAQQSTSGVGGAYTGDTSNGFLYLILLFSSIVVVSLVRRKTSS